MDTKKLQAGDTVAIYVPDVLPDPTDPAFGCMRHGTLEVVKVGPGEYFHYRVLRGTVYDRGAEGSIPFKYADYITIL